MLTISVVVSVARRFFDLYGRRVALVGAIKEAVRLFDCDEDSCGRFPLEEIDPVLIGRRKELDTVGRSDEGEEIAPDKPTMSDAAQRRF